jgi:toxin ParE1/3/4
MSEYVLSSHAELDLLEIAEYTVETWGPEQARKYATALFTHFTALARGEILARSVIPGRSEVKMSRCRHHLVFSLHEEGAPPAVIAVFHEKMDLMSRLRERLSDPQ